MWKTIDKTKEFKAYLNNLVKIRLEIFNKKIKGNKK